MRTIVPVFVVLAIAVAGMMLGMSGFQSAWGAPAPQTASAQDQLNASAQNASPNEGPVEGPVSSGESSIVGLIVNGLTTMVDIAGGVVLLPLTLMNLGFPAYFAIPVGALAELLVGIGLIEFATNREWT